MVRPRDQSTTAFAAIILGSMARHKDVARRSVPGRPRQPLTRRILVVSLPAPPHQNPRSAADHGEARGPGAAAAPDSEPVARRTRSRRRQAASIAVLHPDVLIWEILAWLPAAALLRCRAVCRAWRGITSAPGFLLAHHRRQPSLPLFLLRGSSTDAANPDRGRPLVGLDHRDRHCHGCLGVGPFALHASCDGLLLVSRRGRFTICNPATRQHAPVPGLDAAASCTKVEALYLYPHRPSGEYRVLYWYRDEVCCYILRVPRAREPRRVVVPASCLGIACTVMQCSDHSRPPPVMICGSLHWDPPRHLTSGASLVFDTVAESFRSMRLPDAVATGCCARLHDMEGLLGLSCFDDSSTVAKLWVLEDYEKEVWSLKYKINFSSVSTCNLAKESRHLVLSHDGDMLLYRNSSSNEGDMPFHNTSRSSYMVHSGEGKFLEELQWGSWGSTLTGHLFKESLVKHAFFPEPCSAPTVRHLCLFRSL